MLVVSQGAGYIVDPTGEVDATTLSEPIHHALEFPPLQAIVLSDGIRLQAVGVKEVLWRSPRISWGEIRALKVESDLIMGEASFPLVDGNGWAPFHVEARTGACVDGVFEAQTRHATRLRADG